MHGGSTDRWRKAKCRGKQQHHWTFQCALWASQNYARFDIGIRTIADALWEGGGCFTWRLRYWKSTSQFAYQCFKGYGCRYCGWRRLHKGISWWSIERCQYFYGFSYRDRYRKCDDGCNVSWWSDNNWKCCSWTWSSRLSELFSKNGSWHWGAGDRYYRYQWR